MIELFAIALMGFLRRLQGRNLGTHSLREFMNKLAIRLGYVVVIATCFEWDYWWNGVVWGLFVGFAYLNMWHEYGNDGWDAVKRYGPAGIFYPLANRYWPGTCWSCVGEIGLGVGVGVYTYLVSIIL